MARIRYDKDLKGTNELMTSPEMVAVMAAAAEEAMKYAQSISPRQSGRYSESFRVETSERGGPLHNRAEARLVNDAPYAIAVEYTNNGEGARVLGKTVDFVEQHGV